MLYVVHVYTLKPYTVEEPIDCKNVVSQDKWSLKMASTYLKCKTCQEYVVFQDRWSPMTVVDEDRCYYIYYSFPGVIDNNRYGHLTFEMPIDTVIHGFGGYFDCELYGSVDLSK